MYPTTYVYDSYKNKIKEISPLNVVTEYEYDLNNNLVLKKINGRVNEEYKYDKY